MSSFKKPPFQAPIRSFADAPSTMPFLATIPTIIDATTTNDSIRTTNNPTDYVSAEDRYSDLGLIGKGGMGEIRRAYDTQMQRMVAIKVLHTRWSNKPKIIRRFEFKRILKCFN